MFSVCTSDRCHLHVQGAALDPKTGMLWISGPVIYDGDKFSKWRGRLLAGAPREQVGRARDVRVGADGFVYLVIDAANGSLLRLAPALSLIGEC